MRDVDREREVKIEIIIANRSYLHGADLFERCINIFHWSTSLSIHSLCLYKRTVFDK